MPVAARPLGRAPPERSGEAAFYVLRAQRLPEQPRPTPTVWPRLLPSVGELENLRTVSEWYRRGKSARASLEDSGPPPPDRRTGGACRSAPRDLSQVHSTACAPRAGSQQAT